MDRIETFLVRFITLIIVIFSISPIFAQRGRQSIVQGTVKNTKGEPVGHAIIFIKNTQLSTESDVNGSFSFRVLPGAHTLCVQFLGYETVEKAVELKPHEKINVHVILEEKRNDLGEVVVEAKSTLQQINESAYNVLAIDTKALHNTTLDLAGALSKAPGMKIRESGGVGSDMRLMMDGFSGKHIKVFIDGIPQEGVGGSFGLNKIPINYAERIEVYRGVVPVGFGTDALAGIINIVTNKKKERWYVDASYSYGSFNTHKSYVNFGQTLKSGLAYEINAFQNYSDNDYKVDVVLEKFLAGNTSSMNKDTLYRVKRFHDTYHNEAIIGKVGVVGKKWADRLMLGISYAHSYNEVQNGVFQDIVYGEKHNKGYSIMPSLEYRKHDLLTKGLDVTLTANYNKNVVNNIDTSSYRFNWLGEKQKMTSPGEVQYLDTRAYNNNWNASFTANYRMGIHTFTFNHVMNNFRRKNKGTSGASGSNMSNAIEKELNKNISGLSYLLTPTEAWNVSVFGKYYNQYAAGPVATSESSDNYVRKTNSVSSFGYGLAGTYFFLNAMQAKFSYERAYRLPTNEEMFGDEDLEHGEFSLKPENSDNFNLSLSASRKFGEHNIYAEGGLIYRYAKDYIQRNTIENTLARKSYATYENHGRVKTKGYNISLHYSYSHWLSISGAYTQMDARDNVKTTGAETSAVNLTYGARMKNTPYRFANSDVTFFWRNFGKKDNVLTFGYNNNYVHSFPLYFENLGASDRGKRTVPSQFSHNLSIAYSMREGRYNLSFECNNFTDEKLYDNFKLQKAGRAFYGKFRVYFGSR